MLLDEDHVALGQVHGREQHGFGHVLIVGDAKPAIDGNDSAARIGHDAGNSNTILTPQHYAENGRAMLARVVVVDTAVSDENAGQILMVEIPSRFDVDDLHQAARAATNRPGIRRIDSAWCRTEIVLAILEVRCRRRYIGALRESEPDRQARRRRARSSGPPAARPARHPAIETRSSWPGQSSAASCESPH